MYEIEKYFVKEDFSVVDVYLFTTFTQIHTSFQSYIILLERGLYEDGQIVLRSLYDKMFKFLYILNDSGSFNIFKQDGILKQKSLFKYIIKNNLYDYVSENKAKEYLLQLEQQIEKRDSDKNINVPSNQKICEEMGIEELYIHYKLLSGYTHNAFFVVDGKIKTEESGVIIDQGINHGNFYDEVCKVIFCFDYIVNPLCNYFNISNFSKEFADLVNELIMLKS